VYGHTVSANTHKRVQVHNYNVNTAEFHGYRAASRNHQQIWLHVLPQREPINLEEIVHQLSILRLEMQDSHLLRIDA